MTTNTINRPTLVSVSTWTTGSRRGYIPVAHRGAESLKIAMPSSLTGIRGNMRWALQALQSQGATHYTVANYQGVPHRGYSNQYCYTQYTGYQPA